MESNEQCVLTESIWSSTEGDMILYQRCMYNMRVLLPWKLPVLQKGCVKDAIGVKYVSIACC